MQGEQNFCEALNDDWFAGIILKKPNCPLKYIFTHLMAYASGNIAVSTRPEFTEDKALKEVVESHKHEFEWTEHQVRRAYRIAHEKIILLAIRRGCVEDM